MPPQASEEDEGVWDATRPRFQHCRIASDGTTTAENLEMVFDTMWQDAILNDAFATKIGHVDSPQEAASLRLYCERLLQGLLGGSDVDYDKVPPFMEKTVRSVVALFRGLLALLDPTPGLLRSGPEDVDFVLPLPRDLRPNRSLWRGGRGCFRGCRCKSGTKGPGPGGRGPGLFVPAHVIECKVSRSSCYRNTDFCLFFCQECSRRDAQHGVVAAQGEGAVPDHLQVPGLESARRRLPALLRGVHRAWQRAP